MLYLMVFGIDALIVSAISIILWNLVKEDRTVVNICLFVASTLLLAMTITLLCFYMSKYISAFN